jgi:lipooligosaccharide transport system permease protein
MVHPAVAVFEYHLVGYRRIWIGTVASSLATPVLFFLGLGVIMGAYVDRNGVLSIPYLHFLAPALLASTGLQIAMTESGLPVLSHFKWERIYFGVAAAPLRVADMILGRLGYIALRVMIAATAFLVVMLPFGVVRSPWGAVLPLVAVLVGLAGAAPMFAYAATVDGANVMTVMLRFGMLPMTLFSGVFFPVSQLPLALQPVAYALPLWHGVELSRAAALGIGTALPVPLHIGVLVLWFVAGYALAHSRFTRRLAV